MRLATHVTRREWTPVLGATLFVALLSAGYYYNVTFVQLGLVDLGVRLVGMDRAAVSLWMAVLALLTLGAAVTFGVAMDRRNWGRDLRVKLRVLLAVVLVQLLLTLAAPAVRTVPAFGAWVVAASLSLGVGFPAAFGLAVDLVPVPDRGPVAAVVTAVTYVAANAVPVEWSVGAFSRLMVAAMVPGALVLAVVVSGRVGAVERWVSRLAEQHREFGTGRFCRPDPVGTRSLALWAPVVLMFGVFFVDSLGFLRIVETPALVGASWQSPDPGTRLFIAGAHVVGAAIAGVLYVNFELEWLFVWVFALFGVTYVLYTSDLRLAAALPGVGTANSPLNPAFYAVAVSFYTTLNFALWPDLSTTETVGTHSAIGVGVAGWLATFLSTAVALYLGSREVGLLTHLSLVQALALLLVFGLAVALYARGMRRHARQGGGADG
jgi:MFS family permease